ncbi:hypothetical protein ONZ51_g13237 [Trametes cubensis]|uniref:Carboxylic ester hydrolase n=1 Tax=Trametes cubensis TaxID=1111947 RepID=A0AAD7TF51_9APHY|nr:hypothetical protein ONZ51_g13237 [Trametes cubensis]
METGHYATLVQLRARQPLLAHSLHDARINLPPARWRSLTTRRSRSPPDGVPGLRERPSEEPPRLDAHNAGADDTSVHATGTSKPVVMRQIITEPYIKRCECKPGRTQRVHYLEHTALTLVRQAALLMAIFWTLVFAYAVVILCTNALPTESIVTLDRASIIGMTDGGMTQFLGIPFAQPPVGKFRLQLPQPLEPYTGVINATTYGYQCMQPEIVPPTIPAYLPPAVHEFFGSISSPAVPQNEDCLTVNVILPAGTNPNAKLPVAAWIYGGGYATGSNAAMPGEAVVSRSMALGQPVVYVSMNYRVGAFGFLGGREVMEAGIGNLGLQDQRAALRWIQEYISNFGGDPTKVTIWGESAGSQSVAFHMVTNGGDNEGLFRAAWMESGTVQPAADITSLQPTFDAIASAVGCTLGSARVLDCLRAAPADAIKTAMDEQSAVFGYTGLSVPWSPRVDGVFFKHDSARLLLYGQVADVPVVVGDCEDEGTLFSIPSLNITYVPAAHI